MNIRRQIVIILILLVLTLSGCLSGKSVLTSEQYARETVEALEKDYANATGIAIQAKRIEQARATLEALAAQATFSEEGVFPSPTTVVLQPGAEPSLLETRTPTSPVSTLLPADVLNPTETPTSAEVIPTGTTVDANCYKAGFISDVTIPEWTNLQAGQAFTKTWRIKNTGSCPWTPDMSLVFDHGDPLEAAPSVSLGSNVDPGELTTISLELIAPRNTGKYSGEWKLRTPQGLLFGVGPLQNLPLTVSINVNKPTQIGYDLTEFFCQALWSSSKGELTCPIAWDVEFGAARVDAQPRFEGGYLDDEGTLITLPANGADGWIMGRFPGYMVQEGDHFLSVIGCIEGNPACDLTFELSARLDDGAVQSLGAWREISDGAFQKVQVDLSQFVGQNIELILKVISNTGTSAENTGFWLLPVIIR